MARKFPEIANQFKSAVQTHSQQKEIDTLKAEIEQLRAGHSPQLETEIARLREQLSSQTGEVDIDVDLIDPNPAQPRQTITDAEIQKKVRFLTQQGQTVPIILIPQENGRYLIFDGEVRWRAAKFKLGWETIKAVLIPMPEDLHRSALETFLGFEDLNPLDKAEAILHQVKQDTGLEPDQVFTILNTCLRAIERSGNIRELGKLVDISLDDQDFKLEALGVSEKLARQLLVSILQMGLNPGSVKTQLLPMILLPNDLKEAIRQRGLKGAHALILATLSAKALKVDEAIATQERIEATQIVLSDELNVAKTRELITKARAKYATSVSVPSKRITSIMKNLDLMMTQEILMEAPPEQLVELRQKIAQMLETLDRLNRGKLNFHKS